MLGEAGISAGVGTAIEGGSLANAFENALTQEVAASGAYAIGDTTTPLSIQNIFEHAALGCAASALSGTGCAGGAIGAATSAVVSPLVILAMDPSGAPLRADQSAVVTALAILTGGVAAGLGGGCTSRRNQGAK
jgi:filamentous hemagglutinin